jgi:hypothetical protein
MRCAAGTTLLFDGTRYRAQIIGLLPAGPSFALLFSRERREKERARLHAPCIGGISFFRYCRRREFIIPPAPQQPALLSHRSQTRRS